jgi:hypothetical protein
MGSIHQHPVQNEGLAFLYTAVIYFKECILRMGSTYQKQFELRLLAFRLLTRFRFTLTLMPDGVAIPPRIANAT